MENNTENKTQNPISTNRYSDSKGTGALSTIIFVIAVVIIMAVIAHYKGF